MVRPVYRSAVTMLAAAGVMVAGAELTSYAATGKPLILRHVNSTHGTTVVKNTGHGAALGLVSSRKAPPLTVNSGRLVKHLNAARVGGRTAAQLEPRVLTYRIGAANLPMTADQHFVSISPPGGNYRISITGLWQSDTPGDTVQCVVLDPVVYSTGDLSKVYLEVSGTEGAENGSALNQVQYATLAKGVTLDIGCDATGDVGPLTIAQPVSFTFTKVNQVVRKGSPTNVPRGVLRRLDR